MWFWQARPPLKWGQGLVIETLTPPPPPPAPPSRLSAPWAAAQASTRQPHRRQMRNVHRHYLEMLQHLQITYQAVKTNHSQVCVDIQHLLHSFALSFRFTERNKKEKIRRGGGKPECRPSLFSEWWTGCARVINHYASTCLSSSNFICEVSAL